MLNQTTEIILKAQYDHDIGDIGISAEGMGGFTAFNPTLLTHDIIEHVNGFEALGTVTDEFQALGAVFLTRVETDYRVTHEGLKNDLISIAVDSLNAEFGPMIPDQGETDEDEEFQSIIQNFLEDIEHELDEDQYNDFDLVTFCDQALQGMRLGYEKQLERFGCMLEALNFFQTIEEALQKHFGLKNHYDQITPEFEGQQYKLVISDNRELGTRVWVEEHWEFEEDE